MNEHCAHHTPWYKEKFYIMSLLVLCTLIISYVVPLFNPIIPAFLDYLSIIWWAILLGLLLGGIIDYFVPSEYITQLLATGKKRSIIWATLLGFLMSACSHGILAISMQLYKKGAATSSTIAFLLAAPWANLTITIMLIAFFGPKALLLVLAAVVIAIITGLIYQILERYGLVENHGKIDHKNINIRADMKKRWKQYHPSSKDIVGVATGAWTLTKMVLWWILLGMLIASVARAFVPVHIFHQYMGPTILGLVITLLVATVIEVCSEGSSPIAFEIFRQTGAFGGSFVFLMAGVATDYTEIGLIWSNIGKKAALWLPAITIPQIILVGYLLNILL